MHKQVNYIITAFLILAAAACIIKVLHVIPRSPAGNTSGGWCGTVSPQSNIVLSGNAINGKALFMGKCASCHALWKDQVGPSLAGFEERGPWADRKKLYAWIKNPSLFIRNDPYTKGLKRKYSSMMQSFEGVITDEEIDAIVEYINQAKQLRSMPMVKN